MKIIQVHNYYQIAGGEDTVVAAEKKLLAQNGNEVITYYRRNQEITSYSFFAKVGLLKNTSWSQATYDDFLKLLKFEKPDICHVHNFLPLISPAIYYACAAQGVPVVQTLHNYRLICTNGLFLREGKICEACLGKSAYGSVLKKCYRNSSLQTLAIAHMLEKHKAKKTWQDKVNAYICLTQFAKEKFIEHGLPAEKLMVKANFIEVEEQGHKAAVEPYFIYVGRLTESKGVNLFKAIESQVKIPIKIVGEGELLLEFKQLKNIEVLGKKSRNETLNLIRNATALILPSLWYEGMPMTILEAFALKTPVVTSKLGAMESMIRHQENGLLFSAGSAAELLKSLNFVINHKEHSIQMAQEAFKDYEKWYSPKGNYLKLVEVYEKAIEDVQVK